MKQAAIGPGIFVPFALLWSNVSLDTVMATKSTKDTKGNGRVDFPGSGSLTCAICASLWLISLLHLG
jgi:hypothetical protein